MTSLILKIAAEQIGVPMPTDPWRLDQLERMLRIVTEASPAAVEFWMKEGARLVTDRDRVPPPTGSRQLDRLKQGVRIVTQSEASKIESWLADAKHATSFGENRAWKVPDIAARLNKSVVWMRRNMSRLRRDHGFPSPIPGLWNTYDPRAIEMWLAGHRGEQLPAQFATEATAWSPEDASDDHARWGALLDSRAQTMADDTQRAHENRAKSKAAKARTTH